MSIYLTGASGFIGKSLIASFNKEFQIRKHIRGAAVVISEKAVIHLAGKAHDLKNVSNKIEYYEVNTVLTEQVFDSFLLSDSSVFIMMSTVKAIADSVVGILDEEHVPNPKTHYGKSKLLAENYILSKTIPDDKRVYILRPCMIHGPHNKGNLNLLYNLVSRRIPWILGSFHNKRSFCSIDNLLFIIKELIKNSKIPSGVYNVADDDDLSTNEIISLIAISVNKKPIIYNLSPIIVKLIAKTGDIVPLPLNSERLKKLTESYRVSNKKLKKHMARELPLTSKQGISITIKSFRDQIKSS